MLRKTEKIYRKYINSCKVDSQVQTVKKTTIWFLFIPIYSCEQILHFSL